MISKEDEYRISIINDLLTAFLNGRGTIYMNSICKDLIDKIQGRHILFNADIEIIYTFLVIAFGDFKTIPSCGYIESPMKEFVIREIEYFMKEIKDEEIIF